MQAVILAGGKGTRLKPFTVSLPKPLVPVGDYPIIEIIIRQLAKQGFKEIIISTGHLAQLIQAYCGDGKRWGVAIRYVHEDKPLDTAGSLKLIDGLADNFLVMNGDILTTLDYGALVREHQAKGIAATTATTIREVKIDFGVPAVNDDGFMNGYTEKPTYTFLVSMGVYVLSRSMVDLIQKNEAIGMPDLLLRAFNKGGKVFCHKSSCYWLDIGRLDDYERAQDEFNQRKREFLIDE